MATSASRSTNALMTDQSSLMTSAQRSPTIRRTAVTPDDRSVLRLVRENLRLISALRALGLSAGNFGGELSAGSYAQLGKDVLEVRLHRPLGDE